MQEEQQKSPTLAQAFARYLKEVTPTKNNALPTETSLVRAWLLTDISETEVLDIKVQHLTGIRDSWLEKLKPSTVNRRFALFSHLFCICEREWGLLDLRNPVNQMRKPSVRDSRTRRLYSDIGVVGFPKTELEWVCKATRSREMPVVVKLAVETAMRRSEILELMWENVDLPNKIVYLPKTKNGSDRYVPLSPYAIALLKRKKAKSKGEGYVFKLEAGSLSRTFTRAVERARKKYEKACLEQGIRPDHRFFIDLRFHDLRHEAISRMAPHFHVHELARISGHKDTRMLMRYYHPDPTELAKRLALIKRR